MAQTGKEKGSTKIPLGLAVRGTQKMGDALWPDRKAVARLVTPGCETPC